MASKKTAKASVQVTAQPPIEIPKKESMYLPVSEFPFLERYKAQFAIVEDEVAFPYKGKIYSNKKLPNDLIEHEKVHFKQQDEIGDDVWIEEYLSNPSFRLKVELEAYRHQLSLYTPLVRSLLLGNIAKVLSSPMYGNIVTYQEARGLLSSQEE